MKSRLTHRRPGKKEGTAEHYLRHRSPQALHTNSLIFLKIFFALPQAVASRNLKNIVKRPWPDSRGRRTIQSHHCIIQKNPPESKSLV